MITTTTRKWGNSLGIIIPKEDVEQMNLHENQKVVIEIVQTENPLKELFGAFKGGKLNAKAVKEMRKELESRWMK
ncbi:MAG TPA: AbrB/MazE/SpoVT family DNA-binding domain-containing protein [Candidatus Nanoarchaeia archaeon]|nr:AbrB/MazE/SpoVT family DNA-binding domain-containing protein [Candidatus Nanoarchaeia archaeon]